jgi:plasmid stabilization system protein ParE
MKRRRLTVIPAALQALVYAKIRLIDQHGAGPRARARYQALASSIEGLQVHPCRYRRSLDHPGTRVLSVSGYWVIYEVRPDTGLDSTAGDVRVLIILHPGQP